MTRLVLIVTLACAALGLAASLPAAPSAAGRPAAPPPPPPTLASACGAASALAAKPLWLETSDGVRLYAIEAGAGSAAVVLAHEGGESLCGWLDSAKTLVRSGYRVLAFDFRGYGLSDRPPDPKALRLDADLAAAVARARTAGARKVFVMGSSLGGAAAVQNGASLRVDGIVSLSGTRIWAGYGTNHQGSLPRLRSPFLYLGSKNDWRAPLKEARSIFARVGAKDKRLVLYAGSFHGRALIEYAPVAVKARALVLAWLHAHSR